MNERTVDVRGMLCPRPLIMVKAALAEMSAGEPLTVILDNQTACENVRRFLEDHRTRPDGEVREGVFIIRATKSEVPLHAPAEAWCNAGSTPHSGLPPSVVISREKMGDGPEDLGRILMQAAVNTLSELRPMPSVVAFYNTGVHLACEGSPVLGALTALEQCGVRLLVCGTCLEYFQRKPQRRVGVVSNMYDILRALSCCGPVINL